MLYDVSSFLSMHILLIFQVVQSVVPPILANIGSISLKEFEEAFRNALEKGEGAKKAAQSCKAACLKSFNDRCAGTITKVMKPIVVVKQIPYYLQVLELFNYSLIWYLLSKNTH